MAHLISHEECYLCEGDGRSLSASVTLFVPCILCKGTGWGLQLHGNEERTAFQNIIIEYGPADVDTYLSPEEIESLLKQGLSEAFLPLQTTTTPTTSHTGEERQLNPDLFTQEEEDDILSDIYKNTSCFDCMDTGTLTVPGMGDQPRETVYCMCDTGRELQNQETQARAELALYYKTGGN